MKLYEVLAEMDRANDEALAFWQNGGVLLDGCDIFLERKKVIHLLMLEIPISLAQREI